MNTDLTGLVFCKYPAINYDLDLAFYAKGGTPSREEMLNFARQMELPEKKQEITSRFSEMTPAMQERHSKLLKYLSELSNHFKDTGKYHSKRFSWTSDDQAKFEKFKSEWKREEQKYASEPYKMILDRIFKLADSIVLTNQTDTAIKTERWAFKILFATAIGIAALGFSSGSTILMLPAVAVTILGSMQRQYRNKCFQNHCGGSKDTFVMGVGVPVGLALIGVVKQSTVFMISAIAVGLFFCSITCNDDKCPCASRIARCGADDIHIDVTAIAYVFHKTTELSTIQKAISKGIKRGRILKFLSNRASH